MMTIRSSLCTLLRSTLLLGVLLTHGGCSTAHVGTETGNPPVAQLRLDEERIALVVSTTEAHLIGKKGAVTPGGAELEILSGLTRKVFTGTSNSDGSFDIALDVDRDDTLQLRARSGAQTSAPAYVFRGSAAVSNGAELSCVQRLAISDANIRIAVQNADRSCTVNSDCVAEKEEACGQPSCGSLSVSQLGKQQLEQARADIARGVCADFNSDGCGSRIIDCSADDGRPVCESGSCVWRSCTERANQASRQMTATIEQVDKVCVRDSDCVKVYATSACNDACGPHVASLAGVAQLEQARASVEQNICNSFASDGCNKLALPCLPSNSTPVCISGLCALNGL